VLSGSRHTEASPEESTAASETNARTQGVYETEREASGPW
jgi:hypothetical protein